VTGDKRQGRRGARRCRAAAPAPAAAGPRRHAPMPRHTSRTRPSRSHRVRRSPCEGHRHRDGTPRIVRVGPSSVKGTPRSFLPASQKGSSGPTLERRSLCRPSGPDADGWSFPSQAYRSAGSPRMYLASGRRCRRQRIERGRCIMECDRTSLTPRPQKRRVRRYLRRQP
jgi:hypothetical protein